MFGIGWTEILVIVLIVLLLFGAKRIPELMRSLGKGVHELKKGMQGMDLDDKDQAKTPRQNNTDISTKSNDPK